jgi:hypothetical protein
MMTRAAQSLFWPNMKQDMLDVRANCQSCIYNASSNPALQLRVPALPDFLFSPICKDCFQVEAMYLAVVDGYSNLLSIIKLVKDETSHIITTIQEYHTRLGVSK